MVSALLTTHDRLLNQRVELEQPARGFRVAIDTVFLAASVPATKGDRILDIGCGVGGAMLCVAYRLEGISGTGIEIQKDLVDICRRNIVRNSFASALDVQEGDATTLPAEFFAAYDHVLMNPPYHEEQRHDVSANPLKRTANTEQNGDLNLWVRSAAKALKPNGTLTLIHRADRCEGILSLLREIFGDVEILSLHPKQSEEAKRIIIRAKKGGNYTQYNCAPFVLHKSQGGYSDAAEDILRHAKALSFIHVSHSVI